jgi:hypothetical protein
LWAEVTLDQKKWAIGQPRNFKNCGQREAYFGSPQSEIDLAIVGLKVKIGLKLNLYVISSDWCFGFSQQHTLSVAFQLLLVHT